MLPNVGWGEILIIAIVALVILGPERLPEAMRWIAKQMRAVREFATKAQDQLKDDFGTDFEEIRKPLQEINQLRGFTPRGLVTKHLLDGDDSLFTGNFDAPRDGAVQVAQGAVGASPAQAQSQGFQPQAAQNGQAFPHQGFQQSVPQSNVGQYNQQVPPANPGALPDYGDAT